MNPVPFEDANNRAKRLFEDPNDAADRMLEEYRRADRRHGDDHDRGRHRDDSRRGRDRSNSGGRNRSPDRYREYYYRPRDARELKIKPFPNPNTIENWKTDLYAQIMGIWHQPNNDILKYWIRPAEKDVIPDKYFETCPRDFKMIDRV